MAYYGIAHPNSKAGGLWRDPATITLGVFHVTTGAPSTDSANRVAAWQSRQREVASGYHSLFDSNEHLRYFPDDRIAHGARFVNGYAVHLSFACQTDTWVRYPAWAVKAMGHAAAEVRRLHDTYALPYRILTRTEAVTGVRGFTLHSIIDPSRRTDPGISFDPTAMFALAADFTPLKPVPSREDVDVLLHGDGRINGRELEVAQLQHLVNRVIVVTGGWPGEDGPTTPADQRDTIPADGEYGNVTAERVQHAIWRAEQWIFGHPLYGSEDRGSRVTAQTQAWLVTAIERVKDGRAHHPTLRSTP